jgi:hypothetical protein
METMVYHRDLAALLDAASVISSVQNVTTDTHVPTEAGTELHPEIFYPLISEDEMAVWTLWLPTTLTYHRDSHWFPSQLISALMQLKAPQDVLETCKWACKMDFFETFEIKTRKHQDRTAPLLIGQKNGKHYRIARWGDNMRPFAEIRTIVASSRTLKERTTWGHHCLIACGTLLGLGLGWWLASQPSFIGNPGQLSLSLALLGLSSTWLYTRANTPEQRQQTFLNRFHR